MFKLGPILTFQIVQLFLKFIMKLLNIINTVKVPVMGFLVKQVRAVQSPNARQIMFNWMLITLYSPHLLYFVFIDPSFRISILSSFTTFFFIIDRFELSSHVEASICQCKCGIVIYVTFVLHDSEILFNSTWKPIKQ